MTDYNLFTTHTRQEHTDSIAAYMPGGIVFEAMRCIGTNSRKLLDGFAVELKRVETVLQDYVREYGIEETTQLITEWESAMGIPDECFSNTGTIEQRRNNVLVKLAASGVQTVEDFEQLAAIYGIVVNVTSGEDAGTFPLTFTSIFGFDPPESRFTIIVEYQLIEPTVFALDFAIPFGQSDIAFIQCIFEKLKPANCQVLFRGVTQDLGGFSSDFNNDFRRFI